VNVTGRNATAAIDAVSASPPSTCSTRPLTKPATSEVNNTTAFVMSVAKPTGLDAIPSTKRCCPEGSWPSCRASVTAFVPMKLGAIALTVMSNGPNSSARCDVDPTTACIALQYDGVPLSKGCSPGAGPIPPAIRANGPTRAIVVQSALPAWVSRRPGHQYIAIPPAGQQAIFDHRCCAQLLDKEQSADKQQQNDHDPDQTRCLAFSGLVVGLILLPRVMSIQRTLHGGEPPLAHKGAGWKQDKGWPYAACFDRHVIRSAERKGVPVWRACGT
jgi:hypothetical protein